jgi:hypothetical protein
VVSPVRVLGIAGLISSALFTVGSFAGAPWLMGVGGAVMFAANLYAAVKK